MTAFESTVLDLSAFTAAPLAGAQFSTNPIDDAQTALNAGDWGRALRESERAAKIEPIKAHRFRAVALSHLGQHEDALDAIEAATALVSSCESESTFGMVLYHAGRYEEAAAKWESALTLNPTFAEAATNLAACYLQRGDFARGWELYMARFATDGAHTALLGSASADVEIPVWGGHAHPSKTLMIWGEQGLGEQVLWASMLRDLHARDLGMTTVLVAERRLLPLLARSFPWLVVVAPGSAVLPQYHAQILLSDLGRVLRNSSAAFPGKFAPWLKASDMATQMFRARYREMATGRKVIGISWASDRKDDGAEKSIAPGMVRSLMGHDAFWVNMQYGAKRVGQALALHTDADTDCATDMDMLAAQLKALDLFITVSNTTAHIAAALGVRTWLLEPRGKGSRWYWGTADYSTPWYPHVRVFHQSVPGRWDDVMAAIATELQTPELDRIAERQHEISRSQMKERM